MLAGYVVGSLAGLVVAILIDRSQFLQRGLMPIGNLVSALPIIGIAPIMVMWFGYDWQGRRRSWSDHLLSHAHGHHRRARERRTMEKAT